MYPIKNVTCPNNKYYGLSIVMDLFHLSRADVFGRLNDKLFTAFIYHINIKYQWKAFTVNRE